MLFFFFFFEPPRHLFLCFLKTCVCCPEEKGEGKERGGKRKGRETTNAVKMQLNGSFPHSQGPINLQGPFLAQASMASSCCWEL